MDVSAKKQALRVTLDSHLEMEPYHHRIELPTRLHLDIGFAERLAEDLESTGNSWEFRPATAGLGSELPKSPGIYMFTWCPPLTLSCSTLHDKPHKLVVYIGVAEDTIRKRFGGEYKALLKSNQYSLWQTPQGREEKLGAFFTLVNLEYWWLPFPQSMKPKLKGIETRLIKYFDPILNLKDRYRGSVQPPRDIWAEKN